MATSKEFLNYFIEQMRSVAEITVRPMMGEYLLYYRGKLIGGIYDNTVLLKPVAAAKAILTDAEYRIPYAGAKEMLILDGFEDEEYIVKLFEAMYCELPEKKKKQVP